MTKTYLMEFRQASGVLDPLSLVTKNHLTGFLRKTHTQFFCKTAIFAPDWPELSFYPRARPISPPCRPPQIYYIRF